LIFTAMPSAASSPIGKRTLRGGSSYSKMIPIAYSLSGSPFGGLPTSIPTRSGNGSVSRVAMKLQRRRPRLSFQERTSALKVSRHVSRPTRPGAHPSRRSHGTQR
jgi:hypothetical protein